MKFSCKKRLPRMIKYKDYKNIYNQHLKNSVNKNFVNNTEFDNNSFKKRVLTYLSSQVSFKKRAVRDNQMISINK